MTPFVGEIRMFGGNFAPVGWAFCNGQLMAIANNETLFQLIGTTYGGDGQTTFGLPNLQGRLPVHQGTSVNGGSFIIGQLAGEENHTLVQNEIPSHNHLVAAGPATSASPSGNVYGGGGAALYRTAAPSAAMNAAMIGLNPGSQPHSNLMPSLCVSFIISLSGIFPSQN
jgi:microcystin-dependent protein